MTEAGMLFVVHPFDPPRFPSNRVAEMPAAGGVLPDRGTAATAVAATSNTAVTAAALAPVAPLQTRAIVEAPRSAVALLAREGGGLPCVLDDTPEEAWSSQKITTVNPPYLAQDLVGLITGADHPRPPPLMTSVQWIPPQASPQASPLSIPQASPVGAMGMVARDDNSPARYSPAWEELRSRVSTVGLSSRPGVCACLKLAVEATLSESSGRERPARVCERRGREGDCTYQAFTDSPVVPSTSVSSETLRLVLHMSDTGGTRPEGPLASGFSFPSFEAVQPKLSMPDGDGVVMLKLEGRGREEKKAYAKMLCKRVHGLVWHPETSVWKMPRASANEVLELNRTLGFKGGVEGEMGGLVEQVAGSDTRESVTVTIRRWIMDTVASVHCADERLRAAMVRLLPPELGQCHLSADGSGPLIALHLAAVSLFIQDLSSLPGVVKVEGMNETLASFSRTPLILRSVRVPAACRNPRSNPQRPCGGLSRGQSAIGKAPPRVNDTVAPLVFAQDSPCGDGKGDVSAGTSTMSELREFAAAFGRQASYVELFRSAGRVADSPLEDVYGEAAEEAGVPASEPIAGGGDYGAEMATGRNFCGEDVQGVVAETSFDRPCAFSSFPSRERFQPEPAHKRQRTGDRHASPNASRFVTPPLSDLLIDDDDVSAAFPADDEPADYPLPLSTSVRLPRAGSLGAIGELYNSVGPGFFPAGGTGGVAFDGDSAFSAGIAFDGSVALDGCGVQGSNGGNLLSSGSSGVSSAVSIEAPFGVGDVGSFVEGSSAAKPLSYLLYEK